MEPILTSVADAAQMLGLGKSKIYELIHEGDLETVFVGRRRLVKIASIRGFVDDSTKR